MPASLYQPEKKVIVSIHDLMPSTLPDVAGLLERIESKGWSGIDLLVVPGLPWKREEMEQLKVWESHGHRIVPHGWFHRVGQIRGIRHRIHSLLISRNVAEHLSLAPGEVGSFIQRSRDQLIHWGFSAPELYVPPAWAVGDISSAELNALSVQWIEVVGGFISTRGAPMERSALLGYEADTLLREFVLKIWNSLNWRRFQKGKVRLRMGIHPQDAQLRMASQLEKDLLRARKF